MGSAVHARALCDAGTHLRVMINLEMIGYFSEEQPNRDLLLHIVYPRTGDFIAVAESYAAGGFVGCVPVQPNPVKDQLGTAARGDKVIGDASSTRTRDFHADEAVVVGPRKAECVAATEKDLRG